MLVTNLIELSGVYKIYTQGGREIRALDSVDLTVSAGEFAAIVGRSGSGKSTMMNILGCLDSPSSGRYFLAGEDTGRLSERRRCEIRARQIGFIFQGFNLIPSLTALENVELPLGYRKRRPPADRGKPLTKSERRELALEALLRVGLQDRAGHRPSQLSGGQQQRAAIARAIAASPAIILADEPTGNLDSKAGAEVMDILHGLHRQGHTVLLITHDRGLSKSAERIITVADGRIAGDEVR